MKGEEACARKRRYWSRVDAHCMAQKRVARGVKALRIYKCHVCGCYHLTKQVPSGAKGVVG